MISRMLLPAIAVAALSMGSAAEAARVLFAAGQWAALDRGALCEAGSRSVRIAAKGKVQARAGFVFEPRGTRRGQFYARLSRVARPGSTVMLTIGERPFLLVGRGEWAWSRGPAQEAAIIAAARAATGMRIEARDAAGRRFVDRYLLDGAPTAVDAAAACALAKAGART